MFGLDRFRIALAARALAGLHTAVVAVRKLAPSMPEGSTATGHSPAGSAMSVNQPTWPTTAM